MTKRLRFLYFTCSVDWTAIVPMFMCSCISPSLCPFKLIHGFTSIHKKLNTQTRNKDGNNRQNGNSLLMTPDRLWKCYFLNFPYSNFISRWLATTSRFTECAQLLIDKRPVHFQHTNGDILSLWHYARLSGTIDKGSWNNQLCFTYLSRIGDRRWGLLFDRLYLFVCYDLCYHDNSTGIDSYR